MNSVEALDFALARLDIERCPCACDHARCHRMIEAAETLTALRDTIADQAVIPQSEPGARVDPW